MISLKNVDKVFLLPHDRRVTLRQRFVGLLQRNTYEKLYALRQVNLNIKPGEFIGIIGKNGSGKSTLLNIIGCLDVPTSGRYRLDGVEVEKLDDNELAEIRNKKIGFVFQAFNLIPRESVLHNVELPMIYAGVPEKERVKRAREVLEAVGLAHRERHRPTELSGGEMQRVAIARALVNSPSIILADEPTGNLDSKTGEEIMEIFRKLNEEGITIVLVTHERHIAEYARRIVHLRDGVIEREEMVS